MGDASRYKDKFEDGDRVNLDKSLDNLVQKGSVELHSSTDLSGHDFKLNFTPTGITSHMRTAMTQCWQT